MEVKRVADIPHAIRNGMFADRGTDMKAAYDYVEKLANASGPTGAVIWTAIGVVVNTLANVIEEVAREEDRVLLDALKVALPLLHASYLDHEGTDNGKVVWEGLELVREVVGNAEGKEP